MNTRERNALTRYAKRGAGAALAQHLLDLDLSQREAAALTGVTYSIINRWMRGCPPSLPLAEKLAKGLDTTVAALKWSPARPGARDEIDGDDRKSKRHQAKHAIALRILAGLEGKNVQLFMRRGNMHDEITLRLPSGTIPRGGDWPKVAGDMQEGR